VPGRKGGQKRAGEGRMKADPKKRGGGIGRGLTEKFFVEREGGETWFSWEDQKGKT